jgi:DNA-binding CsgD family transcriptional regulator
MLASSESGASRDVDGVRPGGVFPLGLEALKLSRGSNALTPHETRILSMIAQGYHIKEIASHFDITYRTALCHRDNILRTLHLHRHAHLILYAVQHGIIEVPLLAGRSTSNEATRPTEANACM